MPKKIGIRLEEQVVQETIKVVVDAMGGDNAPFEIVKGVVEAVIEKENLIVYIVGKEALIQEELKKYTYSEKQIIVMNADEVIGCDEAPVMAIRKKKNSSIVVGMNLVKNQEADAFVSAGSTGAILAGGQFIIGRIKGVERPPLAPVIPTKDGKALLIDCGANVDAKPSYLLQFAKMGSIYMEYVAGVKNPRVGIVNIGVEEEKGNKLVKETYPLLRNCNEINFIGSVEARDIPYGVADVIVCEAFVGNVILKLYEGVANALFKKIKEGLMSTTRSKLGAVLAKPALKQTLKGFEEAQHSGAPLLGLNGLVVKTHGSAKSIEIKTAVMQCAVFREQKINEKIRQYITVNEQ